MAKIKVLNRIKMNNETRGLVNKAVRNTMDYDQIERMYQEARSRIADADLLSKNINRSSDSNAILNILGFEILIKCALIICNQSPKNSHDYNKLWLGLSGSARKEILESAKLRVAGHANFSDLPKLLDSYRFVFKKARYFYELYDGYTLKEQSELGQYWEELGAPCEEADVQYYPMELLGLIHGLSQFIEKVISNKQRNADSVSDVPPPVRLTLRL